MHVASVAQYDDGGHCGGKDRDQREPHGDVYWQMAAVALGAGCQRPASP
jgi:hypothetical protein